VARSELGAVLFLVWDKKHRFYRSLCEIYIRERDGYWWDKSQLGVAWPWLELKRPSTLGENQVEFSGRSITIEEGRLTYAIPGVAAADVRRIRCDHANDQVDCPIEPTTGAFICLGEIAVEKRTTTIEVSTTGGVHAIAQPLIDAA
jgi:hypothetical protein